MSIARITALVAVTRAGSHAVHDDVVLSRPQPRHRCDQGARSRGGQAAGRQLSAVHTGDHLVPKASTDHNGVAMTSAGGLTGDGTSPPGTNRRIHDSAGRPRVI
jgi:hypothetical protein